MKEIFSQIYRNNGFGSRESRSGPGSEMGTTRGIVRELEVLIRKHEIFSILDLPCGDLNWIVKNNLPSVGYCGMDIVEELVDFVKRRHPQFRFMVGDITKDKLGRFDAIHIKDLFIHFSYKDIDLALRNISKQDIKYLFISNNGGHYDNKDLVTGGYRPLNLMAPPFDLKPIYKTENYIVLENKAKSLFRDTETYTPVKEKIVKDNE